MIDRCFNPKRAKYADYGGRGITVCARWLVFENFYADMGDRPSGMSLEREDVDGNYEPGNCRWGTSREQSRNKRSTIVTFDDVQEIIGRFEHGEKRVSIARRFDIGAGYVGDIIRGKVWPEIDRPHRAHWKKPVSALLGPRVEAAKEHELLVAKSKAGSTYKHTAYSQPDLTDHRFGLLVVLQQGSPSTHGARRWLVRCACPRATEKLVITSNLVSGKTKSCGCLFTRLTHGQCGGHGRRASGAYVSWSRMLQRCTDPKCPQYFNYGGRGIRVCERWMSFDNFYADMGDRPPGMSLEREDVNGNYEPGNCLWASSRDQARNTRSSVVTFARVQEILGRFEHGETKASIGRRLGVDPFYVGALISGKAWAEIDRPHLKKA